MHPLPFTPCLDNSSAAQVSQMAGDFGLSLLQDLNEGTDANLPVSQQIEQAKAGHVAQRLEK